MNSHSVVEEKLHNWKRIAYTARLVAFGSDVIKALKPRLIIASDSWDASRAVSLAARHWNIPLLATAHGIQMYTKPMPGMFALGDVHCLFSQQHGHIIEADLPGLKSVRIVAHDALKLATRNPEGVTGTKTRRRVFILVSPYFSLQVPNWTNEVFLNWACYIDSLNVLMQRLLPYSGEIEVTIKSHPRYDSHKSYNELHQRYPDLIRRDWSESLDMSSAVPADAVVLYNCISTLAFSAIAQGLPVLGFWGALTPLARRDLVLDQLLGTKDICELVTMLREVLESPNGALAKAAHERSRALLSRWIQPSIGGLPEAVEVALSSSAQVKRK